ncbi:MAG: hypothetical protein COB04_18475 [Gammaproteobacteria bacterium]|nr:MAG: hypothetical protein COB04_18475 [Gammaproteobacteria bacterium]
MKSITAIVRPHAACLTVLIGIFICPIAHADQATMTVQLTILPRLNAQLMPSVSTASINSTSANKATINHNDTPSDNTDYLKDQLCITNSQQILYSINTHRRYSQSEPKPRNSSPEPLGYNLIQTLHSRSTIESPDATLNVKTDRSYVANKTTCTNISYLVSGFDPLSDANNFFADDRPPQVITVTINAE